MIAEWFANRRTRRTVTLPAAVAVVLLAALGNRAAGGEPAEKLVTRSYDVAALLFPPRDFEPAASDNRAFHLLPPQTPSRPTPTTQQVAADLADMIKQTLGPQAWHAGGSIVTKDKALIVTATEDNQRLIADLLEQLLQTHSIGVTIETRFITCSEETAQWIKSTWQGQPGGVFLNNDQVNRLLQTKLGDRDTTILHAPRMTLFSGQTAYVACATQAAFVSSLGIARPATGPARYEAQTDTAESGVVLTYQPTVDADRKHVILSLRPVMSELVDLQNVPWLNGVASCPNAMVQKAHLPSIAIAATVSIPDRQTLLIPGPEMPDHKAEHPGSQGHLFLLIKPTIWSPGPAAPMFPGTMPSASSQGR